MTVTTDIDEPAFAALAERHRHELQVHCYRMLGSYEEAQDLVQETFLRAWRRRETYAGRAPLRAWLYRIATNACLDALERRPREPVGDEIVWLEPYPDEALDAGADEVAVDRETIELVFLVALQHLPPLQRAVVLMRDVLGWPAAEVASLLETSVPAVNSALQRAREGLRSRLPERRAEWPSGTPRDAAERELLERYVRASEAGDLDALKALLADEVRFAMPPQADVWTGRDAVVECWVSGGFGQPGWGDMRCVVTRANRQPAVACYVRSPGADSFRALAIDVLRIEDGLVADITVFDDSRFASLGLPPELD